MEIDPQQLPEDPAALRQMVAVLLHEMDAKDRRLQQLQHLLEQLLRHRYGPRRERVDENQMFLFAAGMLWNGQQATPAQEESQTSHSQRSGHGRQRLPQTLERRRVI